MLENTLSGMHHPKKPTLWLKVAGSTFLDKKNLHFIYKGEFSEKR